MPVTVATAPVLNVLTAARGPRRYAVAVGLYADDIDRGLASLAWLLAGVWLVSVGGSAVDRKIVV